jgi:hypothetical protein
VLVEQLGTTTTRCGRIYDTQSFRQKCPVAHITKFDLVDSSAQQHPKKEKETAMVTFERKLVCFAAFRGLLLLLAPRLVASIGAQPGPYPACEACGELCPFAVFLFPGLFAVLRVIVQLLFVIKTLSIIIVVAKISLSFPQKAARSVRKAIDGQSGR